MENNNEIDYLARIYVNENNHENTLNSERQQGMYDGYCAGFEKGLRKERSLSEMAENHLGNAINSWSDKVERQDKVISELLDELKKLNDERMIGANNHYRLNELISKHTKV